MSEQFKVENISKYFGNIHLIVISLLDNRSVGEAIVISNGKTADIFSFYVNHNMRGQGAGSLLLNELERMSYEQGNTSIARIGWFCDEESISGYFRTKKFFKKRGFSDRIFYLKKSLKT